jgi:predicted phage terminase large subunit-like protein
MRVDPALSEDDRACETAIVVDGVDDLNRKFLLETWAGRVQPSEMFDKMFDLADHWDIDLIGIEAVLFQKVLKFWFEQECQKRGVSYEVVELKTDKRSKPARIRGLQPYFERGEIFVQASQEQFLQQFDEFPTGKLVDMLDAFSHGPQVWELPEIGEESPELEERAWHKSEWWEGRSMVTGY